MHVTSLLQPKSILAPLSYVRTATHLKKPRQDVSQGTGQISYIQQYVHTYIQTEVQHRAGILHLAVSLHTPCLLNTLTIISSAVVSLETFIAFSVCLCLLRAVLLTPSYTRMGRSEIRNKHIQVHEGRRRCERVKPY